MRNRRDKSGLKAIAFVIMIAVAVMVMPVIDEIDRVEMAASGE